MSFRVVEVQGDYRERQEQANRMGAAFYNEWHFNGVDNPKPNYAVTVVGLKASETSKAVGSAVANKVATAFGMKTSGANGLFIGGTGADPARKIAGRGNGNLSYTHMPACLWEPWFITNPQGAEWAEDAKSRTLLASIIADEIRKTFQPGSLIVFSLGHKYRRTRPNDRGIVGARGITEAELAEPIMRECMAMLKKDPEPEPKPNPGKHTKPVSTKHEFTVEDVRVEGRTTLGK